MTLSWTGPGVVPMQASRAFVSVIWSLMLHEDRG